MSGLVRYVGYDPDEDNFEGIAPAPLHAEDFLHRGPNRIDVKTALELKACGLTWSRIGEVLAYEANRPVRFTGPSVSYAVYCVRRAMRRALQ